ncbi:hypothetical protein TrRE_jg4491, partial [Triparma retinervis]
MQPETNPGQTSHWTLVSTGASSSLSEILGGLNDAAKEKYLPYMAVRVNHDFSKVLSGRFWRNLEKMVKLKSSMDAQSVAISRLQRQLALQQHQVAMKAVCEVAAWEIQKAWKRMLGRVLIRRMLEYRSALLLATRCWFLLMKWKRKVGAGKLQSTWRVYSANRKLDKMRNFVRSIKNIQGLCRGWHGRNEAARRRVIREAVRFVVRTSILFGAARASAELMEPHFAAGMIQRAWRKMLRRRNAKARKLKRLKLGLRGDNRGNLRDDMLGGGHGLTSRNHHKPTPGGGSRIKGQWIKQAK